MNKKDKSESPRKKSGFKSWFNKGKDKSKDEIEEKQPEEIDKDDEKL